MKRFLLLVLTALLALPQVASAQDFAVEAATISEAFKVEDGRIVKLILTDARVTAYDPMDKSYYVEDASGAIVIYGINLTPGTALNGYVVGRKSTMDVDYVNDPSQGLEYGISIEYQSLSSFEATATTLVGTPMTFTEACTQANYGRLIRVSNISIEPSGNGTNKNLIDADGHKIRARDLFNVLPEGFEWPKKASQMTGLLIYYMTGWFLIPISVNAFEEYNEPTSIKSVDTNAGEASRIYNLQGVRLTQPQKGLNIVDGHKVMIP